MEFSVPYVSFPRGLSRFGQFDEGGRNLEQINGWLAIAKNGRHSTVCHGPNRHREITGQPRSRRDFQNGTKIDMPQDVVIDEDPTERDFACDNLLANSIGHISQMKADDSELHNGIRSVFDEQNFSSILVSVQRVVENPNVDSTTMKRFHRDGHMVLMDEHFLVRFGGHRRRNVLCLQEKCR